jgi:GTP cyclohydrolase I
MDVCSSPGAATAPDNRPDPSPTWRPTRKEAEAAVRTMIAFAGDDPNREGLIDTPARVVRAFGEWFEGYRIEPARLLDRIFSEVEGYQEPVVLRSIPLVSTCEHHLAPITGVAHVGYCPQGRVVGISKLARLVHAFARRLQIQERLTRQIAKAIAQALQPRGVAVIIEASHACMSSRGVKEHGSMLVTKCWLGAFETDPELRRDMIDSIRSPEHRG